MPPTPASARAHALPEGRLLAGRYELGELIGQGGMAEVYAGVDRRLQRRVAVKLLRPEMAARPDIRTRFEAEAQAAARLSQPNVVAVYDTGEHDGVPYIVMERLPGETLADRMAEGPLDPEWVLRVAGDVLQALGAAHAAGLVHRDVKPGNVLLTPEGCAKVADFGIAKSIEAAGAADLTGTGQLLGTPAYLAPERVEGAPATARSDLYALGVLLYEALSGTRPFAGQTPLAVAQAVARGEHPPLAELRPDLDPRLVAAVEQAMARDPERRFASAEAMARALGVDQGAGPPGAAATVAWARDDGTAVLTPAPALAPPARPDRRRVLLAAALVGLVLLAVTRGSRPSPTAARAPTSTPAPSTSPPTTVVVPSLADRLRAEAQRLEEGEGEAGEILAPRLQELADQVEQGGGAALATALLRSVNVLAAQDQLSEESAARLRSLLSQVPGVDLVAATAPPPSPTTVATTPVDRGDRDDGQGERRKGRKGKRDD